MVLHIPNFIIYGITYAGMGYLSYSYYQIYKFEKLTKRLEAMKQDQIARGEQVNIPEHLQPVQDYTDNHYGQRLLERMKTQHVLEEQIQSTIDRKKEMRDKLVSESNEEQVQKLEAELEKLSELYSKVKSPKTPN